MTSILALLASRAHMIGSCGCLMILSSCATAPIWFVDDSIRPPLPAETSLNKGAGRGDNLFVTLRLETGEELLFLVDTGSPCTVLDKSLEPELGKRLGITKVKWFHEIAEPVKAWFREHLPAALNGQAAPATVGPGP